MCSDYEDNGVNILLDANENAHGPGLQVDHGDKSGNGTTTNSSLPAGLNLSRLNRYPDP